MPWLALPRTTCVMRCSDRASTLSIILCSCGAAGYLKLGISASGMPLSFRMSHCVLPAPFLAVALLFFPENFVGSVGCGAPSPSGACYDSKGATFSARLWPLLCSFFETSRNQTAVVPPVP